MIERCSTCSHTGLVFQPNLFTSKKDCMACLARSRTQIMLAVLPDENEEDDEHLWEQLSEFEQSFLPSIKQLFKNRGALSAQQYQMLERIYEKYDRTRMGD